MDESWEVIASKYPMRSSMLVRIDALISGKPMPIQLVNIPSFKEDEGVLRNSEGKTSVYSQIPLDKEAAVTQDPGRRRDVQ